MQDTQAIWDEHIKAGFNGIGYHRIIKGDGTIVQGRPDDVVGAHAQGVNYCSVGVSLEGNFEEDDTPTAAQIDSLQWCLDDYKTMYPNAQIIAHRDVARIVERPEFATACPGDTLYNIIPNIV
ncbi:MAG: N-acetylmuramoyl-L-alanine amidase [Firmicutes bacterium]|nr:N-acetylmuramoyl-L-alanine amidase [Bacillota bacterium]